ncbi:uncharacterized protein LOC123548070 [Mercenaria mercenaria]|uniref:uncharacterized protein LOC123548070 n=1 Tax=Mercenaria mercenaria TaxID=6596 RepID=UPI00234F97FC|nr:uncharacterized protein LOC123548070 [Mercenaria mercenaria]
MCSAVNFLKRLIVKPSALPRKLLKSTETLMINMQRKLRTSKKKLKQLKKMKKILETILESGTSGDVFRCLMSILEQIEAFKIETEKHSEDDEKQEIVIVKSDLLKQLETNDEPLVHFYAKETKLKLHVNVQNEQTRDTLKKQMLAACVTDGESVPAQSITVQDMHLQEKVERYTIPEAIFQETSIAKRGHKTVTENVKLENEHIGKFQMFDTLRNSSDDLDSGKYNDEERGPKNDTKQTINHHREKGVTCEVELNLGYSFSVLTSDSKFPWFGGIVCLPNDRLVLSDFNNARLILLNDDNQILTTKTLEYEPGHITLLSATCIAVCLMKTNQILIIDIRKKTIRENKFVQTRYHPKCVQAVKDKILVSCQDGNGGWNLSLVTFQGEVCQQIKPKGLFDGHRIAVQTLQSEKDKFRIIQGCDITNRLQCFEFDGSFVFDYDADQVASVVTDKNGYIFVIRYTGEIQVLSPNGDFLLKYHDKRCTRLNLQRSIRQ